MGPYIQLANTRVYVYIHCTHMSNFIMYTAVVFFKIKPNAIFNVNILFYNIVVHRDIFVCFLIYMLCLSTADTICNNFPSKYEVNRKARVAFRNQKIPASESFDIQDRSSHLCSHWK